MSWMHVLRGHVHPWGREGPFLWMNHQNTERLSELFVQGRTASKGQGWDSGCVCLTLPQAPTHCLPVWPCTFDGQGHRRGSDGNSNCCLGEEKGGLQSCDLGRKRLRAGPGRGSLFLRPLSVHVPPKSFCISWFLKTHFRLWPLHLMVSCSYH